MHGYRLVRNHPFPDGNKRVAFLAMVEMAERNQARSMEPAGDPDGRRHRYVTVVACGDSGKVPATSETAPFPMFSRSL